MDPDQALKNLRETVHEYTTSDGGFCEEDLDVMMESLTQHFSALDDWLADGGHLPRAWDGRRR